MRRSTTIVAAGLIALSAPLLAGAATAAPLSGPRALSTAPAPTATVQTVQWRRGWHRGWRGGGRWIGPAVGVAAGLAIGSALAPRYYYGPPAYAYEPEPYVAVRPGVVAGDADAYCAQRFRSYDPASGTYLGYDGIRHPCP
jgi:hypothetical protein